MRARWSAPDPVQDAAVALEDERREMPTSMRAGVEITPLVEVISERIEAGAVR